MAPRGALFAVLLAIAGPAAGETARPARPVLLEAAGAAGFATAMERGEFGFVSVAPLAGDFEIELAARWSGDGDPRLDVVFGAAPPPHARFHGVSIANGHASLLTYDGEVTDHAHAPVGRFPDSFTAVLRTRGAAFELLLDGLPIAAHAGDVPFAGGRVGFSTGDGVSVDAIRVTRLPFQDDVDVEGFPGAGLEALATRPLADFTLRGRAARIDPVFRIGVAHEERELVVRFCGVRPPDERLAPLEQALAFAQVRPWLELHVFAMEPLPPPQAADAAADGFEPDHSPPRARRRVLPRDGDGAYPIGGDAAFLEIDALVGVLDGWPLLTVQDAETERILDRTVPGGPAGRGVAFEVPVESSRLRVTLAMPGRAPIEREVLLVRS